MAPVKTYTRQAVTSSGSMTWRYTATDSSYDANTASATFGELKNTYTHTVPVDAAYDQCTTYTYAPANTGKNLAGLVSQTETVSVACGGFTQGSPASVPGSVNTLTAPAAVNRPAQVVKAERTFYDDRTFATTFPQAAAPSKGDVTMTQTARDYTAGAYVWQTTGRSTYDSYGRVTDSYDANGNKTTTALHHERRQTGHRPRPPRTPLGTVGPSRSTRSAGIPLTSTDANGIVTTQQYDALGRDDRGVAELAGHQRRREPQVQLHGVEDRRSAATTSQTLNNSNGYQTSVTIYDALLRPRQTQSITPRGGRLITDTFYDTHGWTRASYNGWWDDGSLPTVSTPVSAADLGKQVPNQTFTTYDGLGRAVVVTGAKNGVTVSTTTTVSQRRPHHRRPADRAASSRHRHRPARPQEGVAGVQRRPTVTTPADTFTGMFTVTGGTATVSNYGYDEHGNQSTLTDASNNVWTSTYNLLGQVVGEDRPGRRQQQHELRRQRQPRAVHRRPRVRPCRSPTTRSTARPASTRPRWRTSRRRTSGRRGCTTTATPSRGSPTRSGS